MESKWWKIPFQQKALYYHKHKKAVYDLKYVNR